MTKPLFLLAALLSHAAVRALDGQPHGRSHQDAAAQNSSDWVPWSDGSICRRFDQNVVSLNFEDAILAHSNLGNLGGPATNQYNLSAEVDDDVLMFAQVGRVNVQTDTGTAFTFFSLEVRNLTRRASSLRA